MRNNEDDGSRAAMERLNQRAVIGVLCIGRNVADEVTQAATAAVEAAKQARKIVVGE